MMDERWKCADGREKWIRGSKCRRRDGEKRFGATEERWRGRGEWTIALSQCKLKDKLFAHSPAVMTETADGLLLVETQPVETIYMEHAVGRKSRGWEEENKAALCNTQTSFAVLSCQRIKHNGSSTSIEMLLRLLLQTAGVSSIIPRRNPLAHWKWCVKRFHQRRRWFVWNKWTI